MNLIEYNEIISFIQRATIGKSPGINSLVIELLKAFIKLEIHDKEDISQATLSIVVVYYEIQTTYEISLNQTNEVLTLLFKNKGDNEDLKNYRPLSIININYKIFIEILI